MSNVRCFHMYEKSCANGTTTMKTLIAPDIKRDTGNGGVGLVLIFILTFFFGLVFKNTNRQ